MKVPLVPSARPEIPDIKHGTESRKKKMSNAKKKKAAAAAFHVTNKEDIKTKPAAVQELWRLLSLMDPDGSTFVSDNGLIAFEGEVPASRLPKALKIKPELAARLREWAVLDSAKPDDPSEATGVIFTTYQLIEMSFQAGYDTAKAELTEALVSASEVEGDGEDEEDEDGEDEGEGEDEEDGDEEEEDGDEGDGDEEEDEEGDSDDDY